jgi:hypothetical protein
VKGSDNTGFNLSATAKDAAGNAAATATTGSVALDGVAPAVVSGPTLDKLSGIYRAGESIAVTFSTGEALDPAAMTVRLGTQPWETMPCVDNGGGSYTCTLASPLAGTETPEGPVAVTVQVADPAGNTGYANTNVTLDFLPPTVSNSGGSPEPAGFGKVLSYTLNASEPLSANPVLHITPALSLSGPTRSGTLYTWTRTIDGTETQGAHTVTADLGDLAGNVATGLAAAWFSIDGAAPMITPVSMSTNNPATPLAKDGNVVSAVFESAEALLYDPAVTLGGKAMVFVSVSGTGPYVYTYTRTAAVGDGGGTKVATVTATDRAGNVTVKDVGSVTYDFAAPSVVSSVASPDPAKLGATLSYQVTLDEALSNTPAVVSAPARSWTGPASNGNSYTWTRTVAAGETGAYTASLDQVCDLAGNCAANVTANMAGFAIDAAAPGITAVSLTSSNLNNALARSGDVVTAVFECDEGLPSNPGVALGGMPMAFGGRSGSGPFTYTYTLPASGAAGLKTATVTAADAAGNVTVQDVGSVTFDFAAPSVGSSILQLEPFAGCLMSRVTKVGFGSKARVGFTVNEPLGADPVLSNLSGSWTYVKVSGASPGLYYEFDATLAGGAPAQGPQTLKIALVDMAGNDSGLVTVVLPAPGIEIDTAAPAPITVAQNDKMLYRRVPWGSDATGGTKRFTVETLEGETGAVEPGVTVVFLDAADTATASEIGRTTAGMDGAFAACELSRVDRPSVFIQQVDDACNADSATAVELRNIEWTATMGFKVPGSTFENPSVYSVSGNLLPTGEQDPGLFHEPDAGELGKTTRQGDTALVQASGQAWRQRGASGGPIPGTRAAHAMAYDSRRGRTIVFGGNADVTYRGDTWEWDGLSGTWTNLNPPGSTPCARNYTAMAFDSRRGKMVLYGGRRDAGDMPEEDTWEFDPATRTWLNRAPAVNPGFREHHAMAFDAARGVVVLFGGSDGGTAPRVTWEWDGAAGTWTDRTPPTLPPSWPAAREFAAMAYDAARGKIVMHGGQYYDGSTGVTYDYKDTWEWDGAAGTWTQRLLPDSLPERNGHAMVYDSARARMVIFGGFDKNYNLTQDVWEWDGTDGPWVDRTPAGTKPAARTMHRMVYDTVRAKAFAFAGYSGAARQDGWEWDGVLGTWADRTPAGTPIGERSDGAMAFDSGRGKMVHFGGYAGNTHYYQTNEWDPGTGTWTLRASGGTTPSDSNLAMVYDSARAKTVAFGGCGLAGCGLYEWDGTAGTWTAKAAGMTPRADPGMAYDSRRGRTVIFGGLYYDGGAFWETRRDLWEWDGAAWFNRTPGTLPPSWPAARTMPLSAYDSLRGKTIVWGGTLDVFGGGCDPAIWEWDGAAGTWETFATTGEAPPCEVATQMVKYEAAFDSVRGKLLVFAPTSDVTQDLYEYDTVARVWSRRPALGGTPAIRDRFTMAFDSWRGALVLFGGYLPTDWTAAYGDLWEIDSGFNGRPAQVFALSHASAGNLAGAAISELSARWSAGGTGFGGARYWLNQRSLPWSSARAVCEQPFAGMSHLASVSDAVEQAAIQNALFFPRNAWFGLSDIAVEGTYVWVDGTPYSYTNWSPGNPSDSGGNEDCGHLLAGGGMDYLWNDNNCAVAMSSLCEIDDANGANLMVWDRGVWRTVATNTAAAAAPGDLSWSLTDTATLQSLLSTPGQNHVEIGVAPASQNGTGGSVSVDYAEVVLRYRLP